MSNIYDVIVIGAGPGGMGCASQLAKWGMKTFVIDKNTQVGGLMQRYTRQSYTFDFGVMAGLPASEGRWEALFKKLDIPNRYETVLLPMEMAYRDPKTRKWRRWVNDWSDALNPEPIFNLLGYTPDEKEQALVAATKGRSTKTRASLLRLKRPLYRNSWRRWVSLGLLPLRCTCLAMGV